MIDTIRFKIPYKVPKNLRTYFNQFCTPTFDQDGQFQFFKTFQNLPSSYKSIAIKLGDEDNDNDTYLECSFPKHSLGNNIAMTCPERLGDFLESIRDSLQLTINNPSPRLNVKNHSLPVINLIEWGEGTIHLPPVDSWILHRLDICWNWKLDTDKQAMDYLNGYKGFSAKRKHRIEAETGFEDFGRNYTIKFYLKYPEFKIHDFKEIYKKYGNEKATNLLCEAIGILRFETELRKAQCLVDFGEDLTWIAIKDKITTENIKRLLYKYLNIYTQNFSNKLMTRDQILDKLVEKYGSEVGTRLYYFYIDRNKRKMVKLIPKATKYRWLKLIKEAGIGLQVKTIDKSLDFE